MDSQTPPAFFARYQKIAGGVWLSWWDFGSSAKVNAVRLGFDKLSDRDPVTDHCPVTELVEVPGVDAISYTTARITDHISSDQCEYLLDETPSACLSSISSRFCEMLANEALLNALWTGVFCRLYFLEG